MGCCRSGVGGGGETGRDGEVRGCEIVGVWVCVCVGGGDAGEGEGKSEICNALLNEVVYCCHVSCIVLSASHMHSHSGIRHIRNAFIIAINLVISSPVLCIALKSSRRVSSDSEGTQLVQICPREQISGGIGTMISSSFPALIAT